MTSVPPPTSDGWQAASQLTALDIAQGVVVGTLNTVVPLGSCHDTDVSSVADELDRCLRLALSRPPCLVSFSGGRDSSALLAWAADLARREGWDPPIPATLVIPGDADADEAEWQQQVLDHVALNDRQLFEVSDELDCVGPLATAMLARHGLVWPFNTHMHIPIFGAAAGGSVVTGFGGDELGRSSQVAVRAAQVLTGQRKPSRSDVLVMGLAAAPPPIRRAVFRRRARATLETIPWLTREAIDSLARREGDDDALVPRRWHRVLTNWWPTRRYFAVVERSFAVTAQPWNVQVVHPFADHGVLAALAQVGGVGGLGTRSSLMDSVFGQLVPSSILHRLSKASFSNVLYTHTGRDFAREWSGGGVDRNLVDPDRLRQHWLSGDSADMRSMTLMQSVWLHDHAT